MKSVPIQQKWGRFLCSFLNTDHQSGTVIGGLLRTVGNQFPGQIFGTLAVKLFQSFL